MWILSRSLPRLFTQACRSRCRALPCHVPPTSARHFGPSCEFRRRFSDRARAVIPSSYSEKDLEVVESIQLLLEKRIRPVVQQDGGDVTFVSYDPETGFVYVRLSGACVGCAQSDVTLKHMIQGMLCHYLDDVAAVLNCDEEGFVVSGETDDSEF
ncbi:NifU-like domain containing protein, putative [Babesia bigemina]|uniref:NifU-like domain containing protein, putative n=1 Tax=Babesia bigemina TaxID=5866 RepID=A0A061D8H8_BABBI|nr:NifU-like domain containing protein, putative [Babesia bigemina]CDR96803.1 NifU-like domain containing protein, putative [Babesia bigemina]|eukprot:XP_012768989.1 NifU-like domain containing protein, putative [Babesia bigemina]